MMESASIIILLSTYNGELFLREQLDSIYHQTYKNFKIYARDDGSWDGTTDILEEYKNSYGNLHWYSGDNVGTSKSFFELMGFVPLEDAIYVFSDQDDVWMPCKLERIRRIFTERCKDELFLYCGDTILTDENLRVLKKENFGEKIKPSFGNALIENICIGCTAAVNKQVISKVIERVPENEVMHDWWIYLTVACYGTVFYDKEPLIYYRQHSHNVMGSSITGLERLRKRLKNYKNHRNQISRQAKEISKIYNVSGENGILLECIKQYKNSFKENLILIWNKKIYRQRKVDNFIFKILFMFRQL